MEQVSRCRILGEDAWSVEMGGCLQSTPFRCAVGPEEKIIVIELSPGQTLMLVGGTCCDGHDMEVVTQAHAIACSLQLLNERSRSISPINTQGNQLGRLQCELYS